MNEVALVTPEAPASTPAVPITQCDTTSDNDYFLSHVFLPVRSHTLVIADPERPASRTVDRWAKIKVIHFGRPATAGADAGWAFGTADETFAMDSNYVPAFSTKPYWTFERHATTTAGPYREIFLFSSDFGSIYNNFNSQGGETIPGLSDAARCATGPALHSVNGQTYFGTQSCDHVSIGGQIWAYNFAASAVGQGYLWNNLDITFNYGMNSPKRGPANAVSYLYGKDSTRARMWFDANYSDDTHGNLAAIVNGYGTAPYPTIGANVTVGLGLKGAFMVEHYTQCDFKSINPMEDCDGYELHVYGKSNSENSCGKPMPLGIVAILVGNTPKHQSNRQTIRIHNGVLAYRNDLTARP